MTDEITYRAVPDDTDFETRHEAVGYASTLNRLYEADFHVLAVDKEDREVFESISERIGSLFDERYNE